MNLSQLDVAVVVAYILIIFGIALRANFFMKKQPLRSLSADRQASPFGGRDDIFQKDRSK